MMTSNQSNYSKAFEKLNDNQRAAVLATEGPVMVLAGPGTGKTQVLTTRIGYILENTDTLPQNILCLTFTEAGVVAMRERLVKFIGKEAYKVNIHTFHSFCNSVIQSHADYFKQNYQLAVASDLQNTEILRKMIDEMAEDDINKRLKSSFYYDEKKYKSLFSEMKRENLSVDNIAQGAKELMAYVHEFDDMVYKRRQGEHNAGDKKIKDINVIQERADKLVFAARQIEKYNELLTEAGLYDFDDMINWVVNAFDTNEDLLLDYQEQFLYIMVDEFQDTNGIQIKLLNQLCSYWEDSPNVFVVGDDDQAIYRFQGANVDNLTSFYRQYNPRIVCLTINYRSKENILSAAKKLINNNKSRLGNTIPGVNKDIMPGKGNSKGGKVSVFQYANADQEDTAIISWIESHLAAGVVPKNIAIVSRNHNGLRELVSLLQKKQVPVYVKTRVNALHIPVVKNLLTILRFLNAYLRNPYNAQIFLAEMIQYPGFGISSIDVLKLLRHYDQVNKEGDRQADLRALIASAETIRQAGIADGEPFKKLSDKIEEWFGAVHSETLQVLFEKILGESGILEYVLRSASRINLLEAIHVVFNFIKDETAANESFDLAKAIESFDKMEEYGIELPFIKITGNAEGVQMMTAHATKGLEFPHVWIKGADTGTWEGKADRDTNFKFNLYNTVMRHPDVPSKKAAEQINREIQTEDERRLFFVAVTRAEDELVVSYSAKTTDKEVMPSSFVTEIFGNDEINVSEVDQNALAEHLALKVRHALLDKEQFEKEYLDRILKDFKLSPTALNNYLTCPVRFYYSNIMRIPQARSANMGFGSAVHKVFERLWKYSKEQGGWDNIHDLDERIQLYFEEAMKQFHSHFNQTEYRNNLAEGKRKLPVFINSQLDKWKQVPDFRTEFKIQTLLDGRIPITGNLDRLDIYKDDIQVTDYKTGKWDSKKVAEANPEQNNAGGDYWRQIVFYKILVDLDNSFSKEMTSGILDFVIAENDGKIKSEKISVMPDATEIVRQQIRDSYDKIMQHEFYQGCGEKTCHYCNFISDIRSLTDEEGEYEDDADAQVMSSPEFSEE